MRPISTPRLLLPWCSVDFDPDAWPSEWAALEARVVELVNEVRARGVLCGEQWFAPAGPLRGEARLTRVARGHSRDMATRGFFSHPNLEGLSPFDRITASGYPWRAAAENISAGRGAPEHVVAWWLESPGHCANIMSPIHEETGVGYHPAHDAYGHYWTQTFAAH